MTATTTRTNPLTLALLILQDFCSRSQLSALRRLVRGEEREHFQALIIQQASLISSMASLTSGPVMTMNPLIALHYFKGSMDWYIAERDSSNEQLQAFGLANLFRDGGEWGYIPIKELIENDVELDLYWTVRPISEVNVAGGRAFSRST